MRVESHHEVYNLNFEIPSWNQIYNSLLYLAETFRKSGFISNILVSVCRGGWLLARITSKLLENSKLANVTTEFHDGVTETKEKPIITQSFLFQVKEKKFLLLTILQTQRRAQKL